MTILEVVIAVTVLTMGMGGATLLEMQGSRLAEEAREMNVAVGLVENELNELLGETKEDLRDGLVEAGADMENILDGQQLTMLTRGGAGEGEVLWVDLTLQWTTYGGRVRSVRMVGGKR